MGNTLGGMCALVLLVAHTHAHGQNTWSYEFDRFDSVWVTVSCLEQGPDKVLILGGNALESAPEEVRMFVCEFSNMGSLLQQVRINSGTDIPLPTTLLALPGQAGFVGVGAVIAANAETDSPAYRAGFYRFGEDLELMELRTMGPAAVVLGMNATCLAPDSSIISIGMAIEEPPFIGVTYRPFRFGSTGDSLNTCAAYATEGIVPLYTVRPWPGGGFLCASSSPWSTLVLSSLTLLEEDLCTVRWNTASPQVNPPPEFELAGLSISINAIPTTSRRMIVAGEYRNNFAQTGEPRGAIQILDTTGVMIHQRTFNSTHQMGDRPGEFTCLDTTAGGLIHYAQMENRWASLENEGLPDNVHVFMLDTLLNIIGDYLIDGISQNKLYALRNIRSALDGGVYLMGRVMDLSQPAPRWQGWIAKVGREEFATGVREQERTSMNIAPNPGREAFTLLLDQPLQNAQLTVADGLGRIVHTGSISGTNITIATASLAPGLYIVQVLEATGTMRRTARWVKE